MEGIKRYLLENGFTFDYEQETYYFSKVVDDVEYIVSIIPPHEGNGYMYIFRWDKKDDHDRWSNCEGEQEYLGVKHFTTMALSDFYFLIYNNENKKEV